MSDYGIRRTFEPQDIHRQTSKHMAKLPCFWPDDWVGCHLNYALIDDHDNIGLMDYVKPGVYEVHIYFEDRGGEALARLKAMRDWVFTETPALQLIGKTPVLERGAWLLIRLAGFRRVGMADTRFGPMHLSQLTKEMWLDKDEVRI